MEQDIRWQQRLNNFSKALTKLESAIDYILTNRLDTDKVVLNDLIRQGLIQSFEYTHELAWNVMKDYAVYQGNMEIRGSRDAAREAFSMGLVTDGEVWMDMIKSRNKTSHTYNEATANEIYLNILNEYFPAFKDFYLKMESISKEE